MPIQRLKVHSVAEPPKPQKVISSEDTAFEGEDEQAAAEDEVSEEVSRQTKIFDLVMAFLALNSSPSDAEFHALSELVGITPEEFEAVTYKALGLVLENHVEDDTLEGLSDALQERLSDEESDDELLEDPEDEDPDEDDIEAAFSSGSEPVVAADPYGRAAEHDGVVDEELLGNPDTLKDASKFDGAPDEEMLVDPTTVTP